MKFENQEVMDRVALEILVSLGSELSFKVHRCFLNYLRLVDKCYTLESSRYSEGVKGAKHHILPKSMYPEYEKKSEESDFNWNVVLMTHKEHFVAHHLLYEIYGRSGPMATAFKMILGGRFTREFCRKSNLDQLSKWRFKHSEEEVSRMRLRRHTEESKKKMSDSLRGKKRSDETRRRISESKKLISDETRLRMSESHKGHVHSEEHKKKIGDSQRGRVHSEEVRKKRSDSLIGHVQSEESKRKMSETKKSTSPVLCPHCGKSGYVSIMKRWHFDNCKMKKDSD